MTTEVEPGTAATRSRRRAWLIAVGVVVAGLAAVYGIAGPTRNPESAAACPDARAIAQRVAPLTHGEVAAVGVTQNPQPLPELAFTDADGHPRTLADWRGRTVLVNLWATWCVPCRREMPALDALQGKLGSDKFQVVAINIDTRNLEKPKAWLHEAGVTRLAYFADPSAKAFQSLKAAGKAFGMPTTVLVSASGCEIATLAGPAEWASDDALKLVRAAIGS
jgi:thiol-disulfide isomerase/thioredoxin